VTNIGADALTFSGIQNTGDFSFTTTCGASLDAGGSCVIGVLFAPTAIGARTGTLTITDNAAGSPHTVSLQGTGVAVPTSSGPTPTGSYSITISATAGTFVGSGVVVLSVQ
jgi:hypothetical protein